MTIDREDVVLVPGFGFLPPNVTVDQHFLRRRRHNRLISVVLERPSADGPYGAKGVGEMTANSPIPAIANAIFDAAGVRVDSLPITPEKVLRGILAQNDAAAA